MGNLKESNDRQAQEAYYIRQNERRFSSCVTSFKGFTVLLMLMLLCFLLFGCSASRYNPPTSAVGVVISINGEDVQVAFEVLSKHPGSQAINTFYVPRHTYKKGDKYPNPAKDPNLNR